VLDGRVHRVSFLAGSLLLIHGRKFEIVAADDRVLKYLDEREVALPKHCELSLREFFRDKSGVPLPKDYISAKENVQS
jgi:hypothetical protein